MKSLLFTMAVVYLLSSCNAVINAHKWQPVEKLTVCRILYKTKKGTAVTFVEKYGKWMMPTDTLKQGDQIVMFNSYRFY